MDFQTFSEIGVSLFQGYIKEAKKSLLLFEEPQITTL